jgi:hypothetical protein
MRFYTTEIKAINPKTGELCTWAGPNIEAISFSDAQEYCDNNYLGYCKVTGILLSEIPFSVKNGIMKIDYSKRIDYDADKN